MKNSNDTVHTKTTDDIYCQNGYKDRRDYLESVAEQDGTDRMVVGSMAEILGEEEDFDGLISALEDFTLL